MIWLKETHGSWTSYEKTGLFGLVFKITQVYINEKLTVFVRHDSYFTRSHLPLPLYSINIFKQNIK